MARGQVDLQKLLYSDDLNENENKEKEKEAEAEAKDKKTYESATNESEAVEKASEEMNEDASIEDFVMPNTELRIFDEGTGKLLHTIHFDPKDLKVAFGYANATAYQLLPKDIFNDATGPVQGVIYVDGKPITGKDMALVNARIDRVKKNIYDFSEIVNEADEAEDVVTVGDFIEILRKKTKLDDKIVFRADKKEMVLAEVDSKSGIAVVDVVYGKANGKLYEKENEENMKNEGYSWRRGGYGGTGRSYSSLGSDAPRGAAIVWYSVSDFDPKAKGKMFGWRCGPSNFPFEDLLYPNRKYKVGTMVMRNKYVKAGSMSGEKYISIPSYFDAIKNNDEAAIGLLNALGIPLDLTFGMDPNDDYSVTYVEK